MTEGEKVRFWIPQKLAYKGKAGMPAGMLVPAVFLVRRKMNLCSRERIHCGRKLQEVVAGLLQAAGLKVENLSKKWRG